MFKLFRKRSICVPTWPALLAALALAAVTGWLLIANIHPFLSVSAPVEGARVLVVEGWVPDRALEQHAGQIGEGGRYAYVCTTGTELPVGHYLSEHQSFAALSANTLAKLGVPSNLIIAVPCGQQERDRTYQAALAFADWRKTSEIPALRDATSLDVLTSGVHARRTRSVYRDVLGDGVEVGIISEPPVTYDPARWFASSEGVKRVITESISLAFDRVAKSGR